MRHALPFGAQRDFAAALLDRSLPAPAGLRTHNGSDPGVRFGVYRNNFVGSLVAALADTFPVVRELVGADFFGAMAREFVTARPPRSPVLTQYGDGFAHWLADYAPAAGVPYLADMARLEYARVCAFHAADVDALAATDLSRHLAAPQRLPRARVQLHPSLHAIESRWAIVSLWAAHQGRGALGEVDPAQAEAALVLRIDDDVAILRIDAAEARFIGRLLRGAALGTAAALGAGFDLGACLALLLRHGALCAWHDGGEGQAAEPL